MCVPQIAIGGRNKYMINGHTAQLQRVQNLFHSVQLNVNNPHFLIMQGHIRKVMKMEPHELLGMVEEAAGTRMFETKKRKTQETIEKKDTKLVEINRVMEQDISPRIEKLSTQRTQYLDFARLSTDVESSKRIVQAYELVSAEKQKKECAESQSADVGKRDTLAAAVTATEAEDKDLAEKLKETIAEKEREAAGPLHEHTKVEQELSKELVKLNAEHTQLRKAREADAAAAQANEDEIAKIVASQKAARADFDEAKTKSATAAAAASAAAAAAAEKQSQYEAETYGLSNGEGAKNVQARLSEAVSEVSSSETELKTAEMRKKHATKEAKETEKR